MPSEAALTQGDDELLAARRAYSCGDWRAAYGHFERAHKTAELNTDDLSSYGMAAWRLGLRQGVRSSADPRRRTPSRSTNNSAPGRAGRTPAQLPGGLTKREIEGLALIAAGTEATNSDARAGGLRLQETSKGRPRVLLQQVRGPHPTRSPRLPHPARYAARQPRGKSSGKPLSSCCRSWRLTP